MPNISVWDRFLVLNQPVRGCSRWLPGTSPLYLKAQIMGGQPRHLASNVLGAGPGTCRRARHELRTCVCVRRACHRGARCVSDGVRMVVASLGHERSYAAFAGKATGELKLACVAVAPAWGRQEAARRLDMSREAPRVPAGPLRMTSLL